MITSGPERSPDGGDGASTSPTATRSVFVAPLALAVLIIAALGLVTIVSRLGDADVEGADVERRIGQSANVAGYRVTVSQADFRQALNQFENGGYLVANVTIRNRNTGEEAYNTLDFWNLKPTGIILNGTGRAAMGGLKQLYRARLQAGALTTGQVVWQIGDERGMFLISFRVPGPNQARAVWKVRL